MVVAYEAAVLSLFQKLKKKYYVYYFLFFSELSIPVSPDPWQHQPSTNMQLDL